jgi:hypothetical protein
MLCDRFKMSPERAEDLYATIEIGRMDEQILEHLLNIERKLWPNNAVL